MAIQARPAGTRPNPTLMGRVLSGPIKDRVGYGFKTKKIRSGFGSGLGFDETRPKPDPVHLILPFSSLSRHPPSLKSPVTHGHSHNHSLTAVWFGFMIFVFVFVLGFVFMFCDFERENKKFEIFVFVFEVVMATLVRCFCFWVSDLG